MCASLTGGRGGVHPVGACVLESSLVSGLHMQPLNHSNSLLKHTHTHMRTRTRRSGKQSDCACQPPPYTPPCVLYPPKLLLSDCVWV